MMPAFIITGSRIIPATWPGWASSDRRDHVEVVERDDQATRSRIACGMPLLPATGSGASAGPASSASGMTETCTESWWPW